MSPRHSHPRSRLPVQCHIQINQGLWYPLSTQSPPDCWSRHLIKTFSRSTNMWYNFCFFSRYFSCSCRMTKMALVVDLPAIKPNWFSSTSVSHFSLSHKTLSQIYCIVFIHLKIHCLLSNLFSRSAIHIYMWHYVTALVSAVHMALCDSKN